MNSNHLTSRGSQGLAALLLATLIAVPAGPLLAQDARPERPDREPRPAAAAEQPRMGPEQMQERRAQLKAELMELRAAGKEEAANRVEQQLERMDRALKMRDAQSPERRPERAREGQQAKRPPFPAQPDRLRGQVPNPEERREHLRIAMEHLRAAGMPMAAERLQRGAIERRQQGPQVRALPGRPMAELEGLRAEIRELRRALEDTNRRLDEVARQRRP
ncbi:MAG TPA: hypothetical protein PKJ98_01090 [Verrucomicrobiota bacterium]|nr:hypothetical protein [Verrucomicrobiota bacterium]